jgi:hypothetical protein
MSEHITHTCVAEDAVRLTRHLPGIDRAIAAALEGREWIAAMGGCTKWGDRCCPPILDGLRRKREAGEAWNEEDANHLAFVVGWLSHRGADRQMKPVFRAANPEHYEPEKKPGPSDCSIYHDAFLFRRRYAMGGTGPFPADLPQAELSGGAAALEQLTHMVLRRSLIQIHTLIPKPEDPQTWITELVKRQQRFPVQMARYAKAILQPTPEEDRRYLDEPKFYDPQDPIVAICERLQAGEAVDGQAILDACANPGDDPSCYAKIMIRGLSYIQAASALLQGDIDRAEFERRQDVGQPEIDMDLAKR